MADENTQNRINELITELSDCREDERSAQSQILEVISVAGTILGILFGASYLNDEKNKCIQVFQNIKTHGPGFIYEFLDAVNRNITYARVMFCLSLLIFCTAFTYIIVLGINNVLRYHYVQVLEDRLHQLISNTPDDDGRGALLHWNAYAAPVITRNIRHITSIHTALNYACYSVAICCAILFSIVMVISLFLEITPKISFDYAIAAIVIIAMLFTILLFLRTSSMSKEVAQFAWDTAHENQKIRLGGNSQNLYNKNTSFKRIIMYLIYPKKQDCQKPVLIILGYICGIVLMSTSISWVYIKRLLFVVVAFDFLAYQARYQINDIRGLREDEEAGCKNRLLSDDIDHPGHVIKISFIIAVIKVLLCLLLTILFGNEIRGILLASLAILFISTILYEIVREKKIVWLIFVLVGVGYPLRFFVGLLSAMSATGLMFNIQTMCFVLALWAFGSFSSILPWTDEVTKRMQKSKEDSGHFPASYEKKHFEYIQSVIIDRYNSGENHPVNGRVLPLRERGRLRDPWNLAMVFCFVFLFLTACLGSIPKILLISEGIIGAVFVLNIYFKYRKKVILICVGWGCIWGKMLMGLIIYKTPVWYFLFGLSELIFTGTYFILCYQPQINKIDFHVVKRKMMIRLLGGHAVDVMEGERRN